MSVQGSRVKAAHVGVNPQCVDTARAARREELLIGERSRAGSMILTSNRAPQDWYPLFPNPVLAEGALDRLLGRSHHLVLQGRSFRPLQRPDRTTGRAPREVESGDDAD